MDQTPFNNVKSLNAPMSNLVQRMRTNMDPNKKGPVTDLLEKAKKQIEFSNNSTRQFR